MLYKIGDRHLPKDEPACKEVKRNFPTDAKKMASLNYGQNSFLTEINLDKFEITANARKQLAWIMPKINKDNF
ncbi:hypothetical protein K9N08_04670 [Candidatus Gracilibacteria bacterium]|nr:hypothetical protein [Candidatus Gracilibacteria bacterium]MCF7856799.1 hypothetical protein [Candidatus Gracilibacteria bacterium]MCF7897077.1 hypothetical protein [Candidatus Gracilibacteria bacterium]